MPICTDDLREDGAQIEMLAAERTAESTRALQEVFETRFLVTANSAQTNANPNTINGFPHRIASAVANNIFSLEHLIQMRLAFNKANVPQEGRVFLVDPIVEATLNLQVQIGRDVTPFAQSILEQGMARGMKYMMNLYGWEIIVSNRLPTGTFGDGTTNVTNAVANIFMCVLDDQTKPIMGAWRRMPKFEGERNKDRARDEYVMRARWGFGVQRLDTLGVLITSAVNYK